MIVVDQWRGLMLPKLGADYLKLPNIDRLCAEGVTFRNHFTQCVPCGPARASLLTSQYLMNHRAVQNTIPLDDRFTNLAHELRRGGYDPALVGYTTTTPDPRTTAPNDPRFFVLGDIMDGFHSVGAFENSRRLFRLGGGPGLQAAARCARISGCPKGARRRRRHGAARAHPQGAVGHGLVHRARPRPICAAVPASRGSSISATIARTRPSSRPAPYNAMYRPEDMPKAGARRLARRRKPRQNALLAYYVNNIKQASFFQDGQGLGSAMSEQQVAQMRATYCGLMSEIDDQLGRVFDYLKQTGQWDDTLIVFTCDHGEQAGDHHLLGKIGYFDESYRIPMIVRDPRAEANGTRGTIVERFTETIDTMPTILEWLGLAIPRQCDGRSLLRLLRGQPARRLAHRGALRIRFPRSLLQPSPKSSLGVPMDKCSLAVVQDADFKYVHFAALPPLFFDLKAGSRPVRQSRRRSCLCRAHRRICRQDARLAAGLRRPHPDRLPRHAQRPGGARGVVFADRHWPQHAFVNAIVQLPPFLTMVTGAPLEIGRSVAKWVAGEWIDDACVYFELAHFLLQRSSLPARRWRWRRCPVNRRSTTGWRRCTDRPCRPTSRWRRAASSLSITQPARSPCRSGRSRSSSRKAARAFSASAIPSRSRS